jgi:hypothetical protein
MPETRRALTGLLGLLNAARGFRVTAKSGGNPKTLPFSPGTTQSASHCKEW